MGKLSNSLAGEFAKNWWLRVLSPAFVFWALCALGVSGSLTSPAAFFEAIKYIDASNQWKIIAFGMVGLVLLAASTWAVERATVPAMRLLEGYWPTWFGIWAWCVRRKQASLERKKDRWAALDVQIKLSLEEMRERNQLDRSLRHYPPRQCVMPTRLGNILCAAELRPIEKYGLDAVTCWPRLWLLLPPEHREMLAAARASMDDGVRLLLWSILAAGLSWWVCWLWMAALVAALISYHVTISAAEEFADLLEATFDTQRIRLYDALGWPKPLTPEAEPRLGKSLTTYLLRGSDSPSPRFNFRRGGARKKSK